VRKHQEDKLWRIPGDDCSRTVATTLRQPHVEKYNIIVIKLSVVGATGNDLSGPLDGRPPNSNGALFLSLQGNVKETHYWFI